MVLLRVSLDRRVVVVFLRVVVVHVAHLEEAQVLAFAVDVARERLQSSEDQCLAHHAQVGGQRVHYLHRVCPTVAVQLVVVVVGLLGERVVQYLVEATSHKLLRDNVLQLVLLVFLVLCGERRLELCGYLHVVVSVDAQDVFHHVARALHVHAICRHREVEAFGVFLVYLHLKARHDALDGVGAELLAYQSVAILIVEAHVEVWKWLWIHVFYLHRHLAACQLLTEDGSLLECVYSAVRVNATLEAEACVGRQSVVARALANPCRVEVGRFENHVSRRLICSGTLSAEYAGYAHGLLGIADAEVVLPKYVLHAVERHELGALWLRAYHYLVACHLVGVEAVHWLPIGHHDIVGYIHYVVYRSEAYRVEPFLHPLRAFLHFAVGDAQAGISLACLRVVYFHVDWHELVVDMKLRAVGPVQACLVAALREPGVEVACHAVVGEGVGAIGRDVDVYHPVAVEVVVFSRWRAHDRLFGQHDDAIVVGAHANLVFSAYHAERVDTAQAAFLYHELFVAIV